MFCKILTPVWIRGFAAAVSAAFLCTGGASAQGRFLGEVELAAFHNSPSNWVVGFERDRNGLRPIPKSQVRRSLEDRPVVVLPPESDVAVGIAAARGPYDFSRFEEIHLWVKADAGLRVQPFTQSSGWLFRDGGDGDTIVTSDTGLTRLRISQESVVDPSMVETFGVQVRAASRARAVQLEIIAVTAIPRPPSDPFKPLAITDVNAPSTGVRYEVYTSAFNLTRSYDNPYDTDEIDIQARFVLPSGKEVVLPAFWFQDYQVVAGTERYEQYAPAGAPHWRVRFLPSEEGTHSFRLIARDKNGTEEAGPFSFVVAPGQAPGPVRRHTANPLHLQFASGGLYLPRGHNLSFEDGNPDLNGTRYYSRLLGSFSASGENWTRFWMADFSRTALEWGRSHFSGFYQGVGTYSQRAAWRVDQFLSIAENHGVYVQLVLNDHGQFSTFVNARWNMGNPYASMEGGPVPQSDPELFFSDRAARDLFRRRLRYIIARWSARPNLLAWELWNEVQFAGTPSQNFRSDAATRSSIVDWHREMSEYLKAQDPFGHLVTTSSDDPGSTGFGAIWKMPSIDLVQSHHYGQPPDLRDARVREYVAAAQQAYGKPVLIAETALKANSQPECNFDPEGFLTNDQVPASERTAANREHLRAGTVLRNAIWSAALSQSGAMNWWWGCYMAEDSRRNRRAPDFPLNARLFPALFSFWAGEDVATGTLRNAAVKTQGQILAYGLQEHARAFLWVRDARDAYGTGWSAATTEGRNTENTSVEFSDLSTGQHLVSFHSSSGNGELLSELEVDAPDGRLSLALPRFQGDLAVKISDGSERGWGILPRSARVWIADGDANNVRVNYALLRPATSNAPALAGAVLALSNGETLTSELAVPAVAATRRLWTLAEIGAPSQIGLALVNPGVQSAAVLLQLFDSEGHSLASRSFAMTAGQQMARFLSEWFTEMAPPFRGTLQVTSDIPLAMLTLRGTSNARGDFIMTSLPSHTEESAALFESAVLPQVADGGGYQTEWLLLNPYDQPVVGKLRFLGSDGVPWLLSIGGTSTDELGYQIPSHGMIRWITDGSQAISRAGYARLEPAAGSPIPAGGAVIRYSLGGLRSETGVPLLVPSATADSYWEVGEGLSTGIAVVNVTEWQQQVRFELFLRDGAEQVRTALLDIPAGGQISRHVTELFAGLPAAARGYLRFTSDAGSASLPSNARVAFLPLRVRTTSRGDTLISNLLLSSVSGVTSGGGVADGSDRIFAQVVTGAGFQTQFIIANPGALASEGRLILRDNSGKPSRLLFRRP
ncbi:MAG TPA: DUF5060 domain-containing protein [Acidobacteriota bacterium]